MRGWGGDPYEGGKLLQSPSGSFYIVELHGTFRQMGRQYGLLLKDQLGEFYQEAVAGFLMGETGAGYEDLVAAGRSNYNQYPQIFKDFLDGTAETSGLDKDKNVYHVSNIRFDLRYRMQQPVCLGGLYSRSLHSGRKKPRFVINQSAKVQ